jgi:hypothetical protein
MLGILAWRQRWWGVFEHIVYTLGTLDAAAFAGLLVYWQVVSFQNDTIYPSAALCGHRPRIAGGL